MRRAVRVSAGTGHQHNGRTGQIDECQVGVFLTLATAQVNPWLDGELFIPEAWFTDRMAHRRAKAGIPPDRRFQTKPELAWQLIARAQRQGVPFRSVSMDTLNGRSHELRQKLRDAQLEYYADVPADTHVYLCLPRFVYRITQRGKRAVHLSWSC